MLEIKAGTLSDYFYLFIIFKKYFTCLYIKSEKAYNSTVSRMSDPALGYPYGYCAAVTLQCMMRNKQTDTQRTKIFH